MNPLNYYLLGYDHGKDDSESGVSDVKVDCDMNVMICEIVAKSHREQLIEAMMVDHKLCWMFPGLRLIRGNRCYKRAYFKRIYIDKDDVKQVLNWNYLVAIKYLL